MGLAGPLSYPKGFQGAFRSLHREYTDTDMQEKLHPVSASGLADLSWPRLQPVRYGVGLGGWLRKLRVSTSRVKTIFTDLEMKWVSHGPRIFEPHDKRGAGPRLLELRGDKVPETKEIAQRAANTPIVDFRRFCSFHL